MTHNGEAKVVVQMLRYYLFSSLVLIVSQCGYAQIDTTGFPLEVGNRWYYRYTSRFAPTAYYVKTIIDTTASGVRTIRKTKLLEDSITIGMESWSVDSVQSFYANGVRLYDSRLTHDSSWFFAGPGYIYDGSITFEEDTLFGVQVKSQVKYAHVDNRTFSEKYTVQAVAHGVGFWYDHSNGYGGESGYDWTYELIGFLRKGKFYGDSVLTSMNTPYTATVNDFTLYQNFPKPFNPTTNIVFEIPRTSFVRLNIYTLLGQEVSQLVSTRLPAGRHSIEFNAKGLSSGVYLFRIETEQRSLTKAMSLIK